MGDFTLNKDRQSNGAGYIRDSSLVPEAQVAGDSKIKRARGRRINESGEVWENPGSAFAHLRCAPADLRYATTVLWAK